MRKLLVPLLAAVAAVGGCSSQRNADELTAELMTVLNAMESALAAVNDPASAEAAKPRLQELGVRFRALREKISKAPVEGDGSMLKEKHAAQFADALGRVERQIQRLEKVEGGGIVLDVVE
jgi:hypothetical protein